MEENALVNLVVGAENVSDLSALALMLIQVLNVKLKSNVPLLQSNLKRLKEIEHVLFEGGIGPVIHEFKTASLRLVLLCVDLVVLQLRYCHHVHLLGARPDHVYLLADCFKVLFVVWLRTKVNHLVVRTIWCLLFALQDRLTFVDFLGGLESQTTHVSLTIV